MTGRMTWLLLVVGLAAGCGGPTDDTGDGGEDEVEHEWDADTICDAPGMEWACEELPPKEDE